MFFLFTIKVIMYSFSSFFLVFPQLFFFIHIKVIMICLFFLCSHLFLNVFFVHRNVITHSFLSSFFLYFLNCCFSLTLRSTHFTFLLLLSSIIKCPFRSSSRLSRVAFFPCFLVFFQLFLFINIKVITLFFFSFVVLNFKCSFCSPSWL